MASTRELEDLLFDSKLIPDAVSEALGPDYSVSLSVLCYLTQYRPRHRCALA